jgi:hypothetical protein
MPARRSAPELYVVRELFEVPLDFAFRWCTDFSPADPGLEGDATARRKVLSSGPKEVVYEDLDEIPNGGWMWARWKVTLQPPNGWHGESLGSARDWSVDYRLKALSPTRTQFTMKGRRRHARLGGKPPAHRRVQANLESNWKLFRKALEIDFQKAVGRGSLPAPSTRASALRHGQVRTGSGRTVPQGG